MRHNEKFKLETDLELFFKTDAIHDREIKSRSLYGSI